MNLTLMVELRPSSAQRIAWRQTMQRFNSACNAIAAVGANYPTITCNLDRPYNVVIYKGKSE